MLSLAEDGEEGEEEREKEKKKRDRERQEEEEKNRLRKQKTQQDDVSKDVEVILQGAGNDLYLISCF
jgi:hypothetical protein